MARLISEWRTACFCDGLWCEIECRYLSVCALLPWSWWFNFPFYYGWLIPQHKGRFPFFTISMVNWIISWMDFKCFCNSWRFSSPYDHTTDMSSRCRTVWAWQWIMQSVQSVPRRRFAITGDSDEPIDAPSSAHSKRN